ncbi:MAG: hypothetical protein LBL90_11620 [Prevotellaceae bacterium]|nr:hypothetical protein [Prevotellaceae bacterium]
MSFKIAPAVSYELFDEIVIQLPDADLTAANRKFLEPLRFSLAAFALNQPNRADEYLRRALAWLKAMPDDYPA